MYYISKLLKSLNPHSAKFVLLISVVCHLFSLVQIFKIIYQSILHCNILRPVKFLGLNV